MLRPVDRPSHLAVAAPQGGEMDAGSSHRELAEEKLVPEQTGDAAAPQKEALKPSARERGNLALVVSPLLIEELRARSPAPTQSRKSSLERYRKARSSTSRVRRLKKGSVVDEAS